MTSLLFSVWVWLHMAKNWVEAINKDARHMARSPGIWEWDKRNPRHKTWVLEEERCDAR